MRNDGGSFYREDVTNCPGGQHLSGQDGRTGGQEGRGEREQELWRTGGQEGRRKREQELGKTGGQEGRRAGGKEDSRKGYSPQELDGCSPVVSLPPLAASSWPQIHCFTLALLIS